MLTYVWLAVGLAVLTAGAEVLVRGAVGLATAMKVSPLVIGLTVVAFGTSAPELVVSLRSAFTGQPEIALGNVVGSNVFNILAIMGVTATVPSGGVRVEASALGLDLPIMVLAAVVCLPVFASGRRISRLEGVLFLAFYAAYATVLGLDAAGHPQREAVGAGLLWIGTPLAAMVVAAGFLRRPPDGGTATSARR